jgi:hypothetical protein
MENVSPLWHHLGMALTIKDKETEALVSEIASLTGVTETEAVRRAAQERLDRLEGGRERVGERPEEDLRRDPGMFRHFLETEIWPQMSGEWQGKTIPKTVREDWLGYGPDGV